MSNQFIWLLKVLLGFAKNLPSKKHLPVLIVENNPMDAALVAMHVKPFGSEVICAKTLSEAHDLVLTRKFRMIFVDEHMTDGSGVVFADAIFPYHPNTLVCIITGDPDISRRLHSGRSWSIILKGTSGGSLMEAVQQEMKKGDGLNGRFAPQELAVVTWVLCTISGVLGYFACHLPHWLSSLQQQLNK